MATFSKVSVFINPVSGGGLGESIYEEIKKLKEDDKELGKAIIAVEKTDLGDSSKIEMAVTRSDLIILFGGDGTMHRIINLIMPLSYKKGLSLFPIGTGNDLAGSLAFKNKTVKEFLKRVIESPEKKKLNVYRLNEKVYFTNYLSFGFDAKLVKQYKNATDAESRKKRAKKSRLQKLLLWAVIGLVGLFSPQKKLEMESDRNSFLSIIFSGIKSYGGGAVFSGGDCKKGEIKSIFITDKISFLKLVLNRPILGFIPFDLKPKKVELPNMVSFTSTTDVEMDGESYSEEFNQTRDFKIEYTDKIEIFG